MMIEEKKVPKLLIMHYIVFQLDFPQISFLKFPKFIQIFPKYRKNVAIPIS